MGIKKSSRVLRTYRCSICQQIKKNHVCTGFDVGALHTSDPPL